VSANRKEAGVGTWDYHEEFLFPETPENKGKGELPVGMIQRDCSEQVQM